MLYYVEILNAGVGGYAHQMGENKKCFYLFDVCAVIFVPFATPCPDSFFLFRIQFVFITLNAVNAFAEMKLDRLEKKKSV